MSAAPERTLTLAPEQSRAIDALVSTGAYASASEVLDAGLRALAARDADIEHWLHADVLPVALAMQDDPGRAIPAEAVFAELRAMLADKGR